MAKSKPRLVMLKSRKEGAKFQRYVRDGKGKPVKRLEFKPMTPLALNAKEFSAVEGDIGHALVEVEMQERPGGDRPKPIKPDAEVETETDAETETAEANEGNDPQQPGSPNNSEQLGE